MKHGFMTGMEGDNSSKRLFTLIIMILWVIYFFANLFFGKDLKPSIEENLFYLTIVLYGGVMMEKALANLFGKKDATTKTIETETKTEVKKEEVK